MGNETKARLLDETEDTHLGSAHACCALQDSSEYGLQVVRRTGNTRSTSEIAPRCAARSVTWFCSSERERTRGGAALPPLRVFSLFMRRRSVGFDGDDNHYNRSPCAGGISSWPMIAMVQTRSFGDVGSMSGLPPQANLRASNVASVS
jgi:hypothetical protein